MKKIKFVVLSALFCITEISYANSAEQYPNVSGQILFESRNDHALESKKQELESNSAFINIEPDFTLSFNERWSVKTGWRILPIRHRQYDSPERSRSILGNKEGINRGINQDDTGLIVEELKLNFENDDMKFSVGKYNPTFATLYRRNKRIGLFVTDFTEDYELREKLGFSLGALLEDSEITINSFFTDATDLSRSAFNDRDKQSRNDGLSGNAGTLSSYSITMEGQKFLGVENLYYNLGYRSLGVDKQDSQGSREIAYTANLEYLHKINRLTSIIPVFEIVKLNNFTGRKNRDGEYITTSIIGKYSGWSASISSILRNLDNNYPSALTSKSHDRLMQLSIGYKFANNIAVDINRASVREDGHRAALLGLMISYLYEF